VKRASRKRTTRKNPSRDLIRRHIQHLAEDHQQAWHQELMRPDPYWTHLLALHLRIVELDHLEDAVKELL
jgi:hypothetical protein